MNKAHSTDSLNILQRLGMSAFMLAAIFADVTGGFQAQLKAEMFLNH